MVIDSNFMQAPAVPPAQMNPKAMHQWMNVHHYLRGATAAAGNDRFRMRMNAGSLRHLKRVAVWYKGVIVRDSDRLPEDTSDYLITRAMYEELGRLTREHYSALRSYLSLSIVDDPPYPSLRAMFQDIEERRSLKIQWSETYGAHPFWDHGTWESFRAIRAALHWHGRHGHTVLGNDAVFRTYAGMTPVFLRPVLAMETRVPNAARHFNVWQGPKLYPAPTWIYEEYGATLPY